MKADRDISKLNKGFLLKVTAFLQDQRIKDSWIFITEAWRSKERQKELVKKWYSFVKRSNHQDWLAIDIAFHWPELYPKDFSKWAIVADTAKQHGIDWGFDLWWWDKPHFQDNWLLINKTTMNLQKEFYSNSLEIAILSNSNLWKATDNKQLKKKLEEMNQYLRSLKD